MNLYISAAANDFSRDKVFVFDIDQVESVTVKSSKKLRSKVGRCIEGLKEANVKYEVIDSGDPDFVEITTFEPEFKLVKECWNVNQARKYVKACEKAGVIL